MACGVGHPLVQNDITQVMQLRKLGMSLTIISEVMGISRSTLYRSLENTNLIGFTDLSDPELIQAIADYKESHPHYVEI